MEVDAEKLEVLKVWYSVFCTIVDAHEEGELTDEQLLAKAIQLRHKLVEELPSVEEWMHRSKI